MARLEPSGAVGCTEFTDSGTCGQIPQTFFQMLANSIVEVDGHCMLNLIPCVGYCDDLVSCITCAEQGREPEALLVEKLFALDECGNLGLKVYVNYGAGQEQ